MIRIGLITASAAGIVTAFHQATFISNSNQQNICRAKSNLKVATDPTLITTKEFQDICGADYSAEELDRRLQRTAYLYPKHVEVIEDLEPIVDEMVDEILLETGEKSWQPQDFLPDMAQEDCMEELKLFREQAAMVPDDALVVLIGDMVTEEALPTYQTLLNTFEGCDDPIGTTPSPWARWSRGWTSEENRHGDLLNKYLYLGGRCDMRSVEVTIQHLITNGFNPQAKKDPYRGFVYTSFQERATKISHGNLGKLARAAGDKNLFKISMKIAGDEARHEKAYQRFCNEIIARDAEGLLEVFADILKGQIVMPAQEMYDGRDDKLYENFAEVAQRLGVYTAFDYADIIRHLIKTWELENLTGLTSDGEKDRDYICRLPDRYQKLAERAMNKKKKATEDEVPTKKAFNWIYGREV